MPDVVTLTVPLGDRSYPIHFGRGLSGEFSRALAPERARNRRIAVVSDENVKCAVAALLDAALAGLPWLAIPAGEASKSLAQLERVCDFLAREKVDRSGLVIALGGGVVGDLAGFAAASYLRGIDYWQVPTTLLAMVDSAVGGKTAVNLAAGKNLVGAFHQPRAVFCDTGLLATLPRREFASGTAEVVKYGLLGEPGLFEELERKPLLNAADARLPAIVRRCCACKAEIVRADERETAASGGRALLNLGHTFGHAVEAVAGYGAYLHGEAVAIGLVAAARLSELLGLIGPAEVTRIREAVAAHRLPVRLRHKMDAGRLLEAMRRDKKVRRGRLRFVVLEAPGRAATRDDVKEALAREIWSELGAT